MRGTKAKRLRKLALKIAGATSYDTIFHETVKKVWDKIKNKYVPKNYVMSQIVTKGQRRVYQNLKKGMTYEASK